MASNAMLASTHAQLAAKAKDAAKIVGGILDKELTVLEQNAARTRISKKANTMEDRVAAMADTGSRVRKSSWDMRRFRACNGEWASRCRAPRRWLP